MKNNGWKSYLCLEIFEKMNRLALLNFKIFWGQCPRTLILERGYRAPPQTPPPSALRRFAPPCLARGLRPLHRPSLCVVTFSAILGPRPLRYLSSDTKNTADDNISDKTHRPTGVGFAG